jgi:hypothetical protein
LLSFSLAACSGESGDNNQPTGEHVWKSQTDSLEKAKQVEGMIMDSAQQQRDAVNAQE